MHLKPLPIPCHRRLRQVLRVLLQMLSRQRIEHCQLQRGLRMHQHSAQPSYQKSAKAQHPQIAKCVDTAHNS